MNDKMIMLRMIEKAAKSLRVEDGNLSEKEYNRLVQQIKQFAEVLR